MSKIRPLVKYHGGKYHQCEFIVKHFVDHEIYLEPFGGAASVLLNKQKSNIEIYNDLDNKIFNLINTVKNDCVNFISAIKKVKYNKESYIQQRTIYRSPEFDNLPDFDRAVITYIVRRMSRGGLAGTFSWSKRVAADGTGAEEKAYWTMLDQIPIISQRLSNVLCFNKYAISIIQEYDSEKTLIYLDPPYPKQTRVFQNAYLKEMTDDQHIELATAVKTAKSKIIISSYPSPLYEQLFSGWRTESHLIPNHSSHERVKDLKQEQLWFNF